MSGSEESGPHHRLFINMTDIIDRLRLLFRKDKEAALELYNILGFLPRNVELYRIALSHKSKSYKSDSGKSINNERLEFLGDAVLETVVSDLVFHRFKNKPEGFLTSTRSKIVQRSSLNRIADEMGLQRLIRTNASKTTHNSYIGGNAFEALVGAIYLDRGFSYCQKFIAGKIVGHLVDVESVAKKEVNFKSKLLEWTQRNHLLAEYKMVPTGKETTNDPEFACCILIEGVRVGEGRGFTKKESHQVAAKKALISLRRNNSLRDGVFHAKEERTAMEADEVCAVPQIDDSDEIATSLKPGSPVSRQSSRQNARQQAQQGERRPAKAANQSKPADAGKDKAEGQKKKQPRQPANAQADKKNEARKVANKPEQRQPRQQNAAKAAQAERKPQREQNVPQNGDETANSALQKPERKSRDNSRGNDNRRDKKNVQADVAKDVDAADTAAPDLIPIGFKNVAVSEELVSIAEAEIAPRPSKADKANRKAEANAAAKPLPKNDVEVKPAVSPAVSDKEETLVNSSDAAKTAARQQQPKGQQSERAADAPVRSSDSGRDDLISQAEAEAYENHAE